MAIKYVSCLTDLKFGALPEEPGGKQFDPTWIPTVKLKANYSKALGKDLQMNSIPVGDSECSLWIRWRDSLLTAHYTKK